MKEHPLSLGAQFQARGGIQSLHTETHNNRTE